MNLAALVERNGIAEIGSAGSGRSTSRLQWLRTADSLSWWIQLRSIDKLVRDMTGPRQYVCVVIWGMRAANRARRALLAAASDDAAIA